jgi:hypothetical protein
VRDDRRERALAVEEHGGAAPGEASSTSGRRSTGGGRSIRGAGISSALSSARSSTTTSDPAPLNGLAVGPAIDTDHQPETRGAPVDPGERVLDDGRARPREVEPKRRLREEIRIRLALEAGGRDDLATVLADVTSAVLAPRERTSRRGGPGRRRAARTVPPSSRCAPPGTHRRGASSCARGAAPRPSPRHPWRGSPPRGGRRASASPVSLVESRSGLDGLRPLDQGRRLPPTRRRKRRQPASRLGRPSVKLRDPPGVSDGRSASARSAAGASWKGSDGHGRRRRAVSRPASRSAM